MTVLLQITDLTVTFAGGGAPAVQGVSLSLERGEIFGLVGESGSGKSTIANAVMGLLPQGTRVSGNVRLEGQPLLGRTEAEWQGLRGNLLSMIFQDAAASLDPTWAVGEQIAETVRAHRTVSRRAARQRALELMAEVGIPDPARRYSDPPHRFSGGQKQRIVIAAALANEPRLLIADEPTTALDVTIQAQILQLILRLRKDHGTAVLLITHDLGVVAQVCDRVGVMRRGLLVETGAARQVLTAPRHPYTRGLLASNPAWVPRGQRLPVLPREWAIDGGEAT